MNENTDLFRKIYINLRFSFGRHHFLIKIKLHHSLGRPSRSDFVQSEFGQFGDQKHYEKQRFYLYSTYKGFYFNDERSIFISSKGGVHMNQSVTGKFIALKRKQKNLTQEQLAEKLGVSNKTISKWETGV